MHCVIAPTRREPFSPPNLTKPVITEIRSCNFMRKKTKYVSVSNKKIRKYQ